jgi:CRISPR-associated protein Cmr4
MYHKAYGIIETLAPLHVGASSGEENGNLNLIFRDQFTQTGIIPGSSIRGRFRADMRLKRLQNPQDRDVPQPINDRYWYGHEAVSGSTDGGTTEAIVKFEYASLVWLPVFCPGQPVVWVTCPRLLKRYKQIVGLDAPVPLPYTAASNLQARKVPGTNHKVLFFNLGFLTIEHTADLRPWIPANIDLDPRSLVVVDDSDIAQIHDMALYRQSRVKLEDDVKKVANQAFFNVEALPEGCILIFPVALKESGWKPFNKDLPYSLYFGGLESVGFGRCQVSLGGEA